MALLSGQCDFEVEIFAVSVELPCFSKREPQNKLWEESGDLMLECDDLENKWLRTHFALCVE